MQKQIFVNSQRHKNILLLFLSKQNKKKQAKKIFSRQQAP